MKRILIAALAALAAAAIWDVASRRARASEARRRHQPAPDPFWVI